MAEHRNFDVIVIGAGPGGYTAAIRASQLGLKAAVVDRRASLGGTCVNIGCIPAKSLLDTTEFYSSIKDRAGDYGIRYDNLRYDLAAFMQRKNAAVERFARGVSILMKENGIAVFHGTARIAAPGEVEVSLAGGGTQSLRGTDLVLATGSVPVSLPSVPFDGTRVVSSEEALSFDAVPESLAVIGAGAVGLELGSVWMRLGSRVTVIELADRILPEMDRQLGRSLMQVLKKQGMEFHLSTGVSGFEVKKGKIELTGTKSDGGTIVIAAEKVLVAVGRKAALEGLGLPALKIDITPGGKIKVNPRFETTVPHIYAVGDIIEGPMLAHKAGEEGAAVAEIIAGKPGHVNYGTVPGVVYTWPEAASVGMTEDRCKAESIPFTTGMFYFRANGRGITSGNLDGFVKIIAHAGTDRVLGAGILGPWASDLIAEIVSVMEFGGSSEDIARTMHAHPTLSEVVKEAALDAEGRAVHAGPKRKRG